MLRGPARARDMGARPGAMKAQMCLTKEMVEREELPMQHWRLQDDAAARRQQIDVRVHLHEAGFDGEVVYTLLNPEAYTFRMTMSASM